MSKTKTDVINRALRQIGVVAGSEDADADQADYCGDTLDALAAELPSRGVSETVDLSAIADGAFLAWSALLAAEVASHYEVAGPSRSRGWTRVIAFYVEDDRTDRRDTNDDGLIDDDEHEAGLRATYF